MECFTNKAPNSGLHKQLAKITSLFHYILLRKLAVELYMSRIKYSSLSLVPIDVNPSLFIKPSDGLL